MCSLEMFNGPMQQAELAMSKSCELFDSLEQLSTLRCLDLSKNKFPHQVCLKMIKILPRLPRLQMLALCNVNLSDENVYQFCQMLTNLRTVRKLNISNNQGISANSMAEVVGSFKTMPELRDIDLSKNACNAVQVFKELADLIIQNKKLKSISMQRTGMTDALANFLSEPLVRA